MYTVIFIDKKANKRVETELVSVVDAAMKLTKLSGDRLEPLDIIREVETSGNFFAQNDDSEFVMNLSTPNTNHVIRFINFLSSEDCVKLSQYVKAMSGTKSRHAKDFVRNFFIDTFSFRKQT